MCHQQLIESMSCSRLRVIKRYNKYYYAVFLVQCILHSSKIQSIHSHARNQKQIEKNIYNILQINKIVDSSCTRLLRWLFRVFECCPLAIKLKMAVFVTCIAIGWWVTEVGGVSVVVIVPLIGRRGWPERGVKSCHRTAQIVVGGWWAL